MAHIADQSKGQLITNAAGPSTIALGAGELPRAVSLFNPEAAESKRTFNQQPRKGASFLEIASPIYRNSHIVLICISPKPASYQPGSPAYLQKSGALISNLLRPLIKILFLYVPSGYIKIKILRR